MVVNYYFDGDTTYIPAHRDTVHCLEDNSYVFCLSLGAERSFILSSNDDIGKYKYDELQIAKEWRVTHGILIIIIIYVNIILS
jgi:alkylated DNA repair dioxygenase AlkB